MEVSESTEKVRHASNPDAEAEADPNESTPLTITVHHHGKPHTFTLIPSSTLADLSSLITEALSIPVSNQKFMISPKPGMLKPPFRDDVALGSLLQLESGKKMKITLYGSTETEIGTLNESISSAREREERRAATRRAYARPTATKPTSTAASASNPYTFHTLLPLPHLPNPSRSHAFLSRLASDPGILSTMRTHKFSVPLLTEMDPATHTTSNSRTLGLNRNKGEVIELRLRTDAYDGYRDYKTIRNTLCHELAHCVHGDHGREFWELTKRIEREVERGDYWGQGGNTLSKEEFYEPVGGGGGGDWEGEGEHVDEGGWTGGEFILGGLGGGGDRRGEGVGSGLSRREILARAAEKRMKMERGKERGEGGEKS